MMMIRDVKEEIDSGLVDHVLSSANEEEVVHCFRHHIRDEFP